MVFLLVLACDVRPARVAGEHPGFLVDPDLLPGSGARTACLLGGPHGSDRGSVFVWDVALRPARGHGRRVLLLLPVSDPAHPGFVLLVWMAKPDLHAVADSAGRDGLLARA